MTKEREEGGTSPVALITGASRGIGAETAERFAVAGYDVVVVARSTRSSPGRLPGSLEETADLVEAAGRRALVLAFDVRDETAIHSAIEEMYETFGRCDVLVNNAGVNVADGLLETSLKRWRLVLDINLTAPFLLIREIVPRMMAAGQGRVINISSGAATVPAYPFISYCASKRGLEALSEGLGLQTGPNVAVNALQVDAVVWSEGLAAVEGDVEGAERPERVADAIVWLASQPLVLSGKTIRFTEVMDLLAPVVE
jgi:citronellol/citronellal dehydrogenase